MKKALALVMAIAMVASMAAIASAATLVEANPAPSTTPVATLTAVADNLVKFGTTAATKYDATSAGVEKFGTTLYVILGGNEIAEWTTADKAAGALAVSATWTENGSYVSGVELVKKKIAKIDDYTLPTAKSVYMVAISTVAGTSLDDVNVEGKVYLKGKSGTDKGEDKDKVDAYFNVAFSLGYPTTANTVASGVSVTETKATVYDFTAFDDADVDNEFVINFDKFAVTANVVREKKVLLACDTAVIDAVEEAYPEANIDYYALTGSFKKTAEVLVDLAEDEFLYAVVDGEVVEVNGEYDDWTEEFTFKTKKLGTYIISDVELVVADVVAANPSTGAAA